MNDFATQQVADQLALVAAQLKTISQLLVNQNAILGKLVNEKEQSDE